MFEGRANKLVARPFLYVTGGLAVLAVGTLIWSVFGRLKLESSGVGLLVRGDHFITVSSKQQGVIKSQYFKLNQQVKAGDILVSLDTEDTQLALDASDQTLELSQPLSELSQEAGKQAEMLAKANIFDSQAILARNIKSLENIIDQQQQAFNGVESLYSSNLASSSELTTSYSSLLQLKQQLFDLKSNARQQQINYRQLQQANAQSSVNLGAQNISTRSSAEESKLLIKQSREIRAPIDGTIISYNIPVGGFANPGDPVITLVPNSGPLRALILVGSTQFGQIRTGDQALISPADSPAIRFGYIRGRVYSKSIAPATSAELLKAFGSQDIVNTLLNSFNTGNQPGNLPYLVDIQLEEINHQPVWTLGKQPPWGVSPGRGLTARVITQEVAPISLLIPFLRGL